jgi:hypothetical protein
MAAPDENDPPKHIRAMMTEHPAMAVLRKNSIRLAIFERNSCDVAYGWRPWHPPVHEI